MTCPDVGLRRSVSKRLKYYFELRQLEDGFDLSGLECPRTDRPLTRASSALQHGRLYDRSPKHYFHKPTVKQALTQLEPKSREVVEIIETNEVDSRREKEIKESLIKYMRNYRYNTASPSDACYIRNHRNQGGRTIEPTIIHDSSQHNRKMLLYERNSFQTSSQPPHWFSQKQNERIVRNASRILVTTEAEFNKTLESSGEKTDTDDNKSENKVGKSRNKKRITSPHHESVDEHREKYSIKVEREMSSGLKQQNKRHSRNLSKGSYDTKPKNKVPKSPSPAYPDTTKHKTNEQSHSSRKMHGMLSSNSNGKRSKSATHDNSERRRHNMKPESRKGTNGLKTKTTRNFGTQTTGELLKNYNPSDQVLTGDKEVKYHVDVHTGKHSGAATKADISVVLIGVNGRTKYLPLSKALTAHKIKFKKNQHDVFELLAPSVGELERIRIGHTKKQPEYKWFVESVIVRDFSTSTEYRILCEKWLSGAFGDQETFGDFPITSSCMFIPDDADYVKYNSEETYIAMVSTKDKSSDNTSELVAVASYEEENPESLIVEAEERKTEVDKDSNDGSSDDDQTSTSSELSKRGVRILVPSTSQNVEESVTERKASEEQNIEVDDDSSDDDREIDVLPGHEEESAEIPVSPKALQTVEIPTSDSENDVVRLKIAENESDDYFANSDSESDDDELDDSESDEDVDYPVSPFASNPKLLSLQDAIKAGNLEKVKEITETDYKLLNEVVTGGLMPIHLAVHYNRLQVLKWMTTQVEDIDIESKNGYSALQLAAQKGYVPCMEVLFAMGAKINYCTISSGRTALHYASESGQTDCVNYLLTNGANRTATDREGNTPLDLALKSKHVKIIDLLKQIPTSELPVEKKGATGDRELML